MRVVIAGGHGQIAQRLSRLLSARGDQPEGLIRHVEQFSDLEAVGAHPIVLDLEMTSVDGIAEHLRGADAAVFCAGAGPGSTMERTDAVDYAGCVLLSDAARAAGVRRFVVVSSLGASLQPRAGLDPHFANYLRAKGAADEYVMAQSALDWTILRPGPLTDTPGTNRVLLATTARGGSVPRDDVAAVLAALLLEPRTAGKVLELASGETPVYEAVAQAAAE